MFSGIVETIGIIRNILKQNDCIHFTITPKLAFSDLNIGDSIAVNGVCLTVTASDNQDFQVTAVPETLRLTNLSLLLVASQVNLERSLKMDARIGGHYVQGHVDGVGEILELTTDGKQTLLATISLPHALAKYIVKKGYITLDGMSITVIEAEPTWFTVTLIPHTQEVTIVKQYQRGTRVNLEVDILGKYVEKLLQSAQTEC